MKNIEGKDVAAILVAMIFFAMVVAVGFGGGQWSATLKMANNSQTLVVSLAEQVQYTVTLPESSGESGTFELKPHEVKAPGWKETFLDAFPRPGRWTLVYGPHEIDIMQAAIFINRTEYSKGSTAVLKPVE